MFDSLIVKAVINKLVGKEQRVDGSSLIHRLTPVVDEVKVYSSSPATGGRKNVS